MGRTRWFEPAVVTSDGVAKRAFRLTCGSCPATLDMTFNRIKGVHTGGNGDEEKQCRMITQAFGRRGWHAGSRGRDDRCPDCLRGDAKKLTTTTKEVKMESATILPMQADAPRQPSREDRRLVHDKLTEVYRENVGYLELWTDAAVAKDLGCPVAWVTSIRDDFFGPEAGNEKIAQHVAEAQELRDEWGKLLARMQVLEEIFERETRVLVDINAQLKIAQPRMERIERDLLRVENMLKPRK